MLIHLHLNSYSHCSAVRAVSWSDGTNLFATASDPFKSEEVGLVSIFEFPTVDALSSVHGMLM